MRIAIKLLALVVFVALAVWALRSESVDGAAPPAAATPALDVFAAAGLGDDSWRRDAVWDDGKAEFCAYEVEWARYGERWPGLLEHGAAGRRGMVARRTALRQCGAARAPERRNPWREPR